MADYVDFVLIDFYTTALNEMKEAPNLSARDENQEQNKSFEKFEPGRVKRCNQLDD